MEEKKLNDEEAIKLLETFANDNEICGTKSLSRLALDLIHRLQTEIKRLKENNANQVRMRCDMQRKFDDLQNLCIEQKAEIERLTGEKAELKEEIILLSKQLTEQREQFLLSCMECHYKKDLALSKAHGNELQKQVDELEQLLLITKTNKSIEQKKTVKEYAENLKLRLFEYMDNDVSYDEFCKANVVCGEIDDIAKKQYGVEVD